MSYVGGMTQDEIATQLGVSRPGVQRLLALARQEGLVKVHIDHPISTCMALGSALRERFLLPAPVVAESLAEKEAMLSQRLFKAIADVARESEAAFIGIGRIDRQATLFQDHFISESELDELLGREAVGELLGWPLNRRGEVIDCSITRRVTSLPLERFGKHLMVGIAGGRDKAPAILAALRGGWLKGLITDEIAARHILEAME